MDDHETIVVPIILLDDLGNVQLVLQIDTTWVDQCLKLVHSESNSIVEWGFGGDQSVLVAIFTLANLSIIESLIGLESACEARRGLVSHVCIHHSQGPTSDDNEHIWKFFVWNMLCRLIIKIS